MAATYTWDVFASLDGYGSHHGDWGGYWGKEGPDLLAHRRAQYEPDHRIVFGATTYREFARFADEGAFDEGDADDTTWPTRMRQMPLTVVSSTLRDDEIDWPARGAVAAGPPADVVRRLKDEDDTPIRSHGSLRLNWALLHAGLVDRIQVTIFPVVTGTTGDAPVFRGAGDLDLELLEHRTLDGRTQELVYRPSRHG